MQENKQEKSPIKHKILFYLDSIGVSQYDFYKKTGITRGILGQNNGISEDNLARFLAYYPEVNPAWLLTGEGEMIKENSTDAPMGTIVSEPTTSYGRTPEADIYCKMYREKDAEVSTLRELVGALRNEAETLKQENERLKNEVENFKRETTPTGRFIQNSSDAESVRVATAKTR